MAEFKIYGEKQRLQFCLLRSLNNLFQERDVFTRAMLSAISERLVVDDPGQGLISVFYKPRHNAVTEKYDALEEKRIL